MLRGMAGSAQLFQRASSHSHVLVPTLIPIDQVKESVVCTFQRSASSRGCSNRPVSTSRVCRVAHRIVSFKTLLRENASALPTIRVSAPIVSIAF